jgi:hypothetical protein|tara:strand:+ start:7843 stop:8310 length:468 start_codon:yes stop_codon:yes gene_type:complete
MARRKSIPEIAEGGNRDERSEIRETGREGKGRQKRIPMGVQQPKMLADERPGYVRYWFNDKGTRLSTAERAGYSYVKENGENRSMSVGTHEDGRPLRAYLMEITQEFYDEDQAAKQVPLDEFETAINSGLPQGAQPGDQGQFYSESSEGGPLSRS